MWPLDQASPATSPAQGSLCKHVISLCHNIRRGCGRASLRAFNAFYPPFCRNISRKILPFRITQQGKAWGLRLLTGHKQKAICKRKSDFVICTNPVESCMFWPDHNRRLPQPVLARGGQATVIPVWIYRPRISAKKSENLQLWRLQPRKLRLISGKFSPSESVRAGVGVSGVAK